MYIDIGNLTHTPIPDSEGRYVLTLRYEGEVPVLEKENSRNRFK
jgi:hypothetical protein